MYVKAKKILASELMYAKNMGEEETFEWLEDVLTSQDKAKPAAKKTAAAPKATAVKPAAAKKKTAATV
jgi:hypothetical protein